MPTNIRIIHAHDFIRATPDGELDLEATKKLLLEIASAATHLDRYHILVDTRRTQSRMSIMDLWYLAVELSKVLQAFRVKTAVLSPSADFDSAKFLALCAQNRGFRIKAFTSFEDAINWLIEIEPYA
ncbi:MAG TPA: hypothetical protein VMT62_07410 [Syntrophorhabdaceae bacterium]|nr:hypothetical protein [Syntrophorhabdaceae bacterium]